MNYDTVIFDLDGTLLDTLEDLQDSVNAALNQFGYERMSREQVRSFVGNGVERLIEQCLPEGRQTPQFEKILACFRSHYSGNSCNKTKPYPGVQNLLEQLREKGYRMAIVSNKYDAAVKTLNEQYFEGFIPAAIGESQGVSRKPAPDSVFKAMEELGSVQALYVGDSEVDIETARNAGLNCILVSWGFRDREYLRQSGAEIIIDTPDELLQFV